GRKSVGRTKASWISRPANPLRSCCTCSSGGSRCIRAASASSALVSVAATRPGWGAACSQRSPRYSAWSGPVCCEPDGCEPDGSEPDGSEPAALDRCPRRKKLDHQPRDGGGCRGPPGGGGEAGAFARAVRISRSTSPRF